MKTPESPPRSTPHRPEYADERDMQRFWQEVAPKREPLKQRWYIPGLLVFVVLSIPWYFPAGHLGRVIGGLPLWVWIAVGCTFGVSCLTASATLWFWSDDDDDDNADDNANDNTDDNADAIGDGIGPHSD